MFSGEGFHLRQIDIKKPLKVSSGYKQMQLLASWVCDNFCYYTALVVSPVLEPPKLDAFGDVLSGVRIPADLERLVEKRREITSAAGRRHGLRLWL